MRFCAGPALAGIEQAGWSPAWQVRLLEAARDAGAGLDDLEKTAAAICQTLKLDGFPRSRTDLQRLVASAGLLTEPIGWGAA